MRHSLMKNLKSTHRKFQFDNSNSSGEIDVQKIKVKKIILNSNFFKFWSIETILIPSNRERYYLSECA